MVGLVAVGHYTELVSGTGRQIVQRVRILGQIGHFGVCLGPAFFPVKCPRGFIVVGSPTQFGRGRGDIGSKPGWGQARRKLAHRNVVNEDIKAFRINVVTSDGDIMAIARIIVEIHSICTKTTIEDYVNDVNFFNQGECCRIDRVCHDANVEFFVCVAIEFASIE